MVNTIFNNAEELSDEIRRYINNCDIDFFPTFHGLQLHLQLNTIDWNNYADGVYDTDNDKYSEVIEFGVLQIADLIEKKMMSKMAFTTGLKSLLTMVDSWLRRKITQKENNISENDKSDEIANLLKKVRKG